MNTVGCLTLLLVAAPGWQPELPGPPEAAVWRLAETPVVAVTVEPSAPRPPVLSLTVTSAQPTAARLTLRLLAPDADNTFEVGCVVDWRGPNRLQFEREAGWRRQGAPTWDAISRLELAGTEGFCGPTVLTLSPPEWGEDAPRWEMSAGEWLVEPFYRGVLSPRDRWALTGAERAPRWNAAGLRKPVGAVAVMRRDHRLSLAGAQALRVQAALPRWATLAVHAVIDGVERVVVPPTPGTNGWAEYRGEVQGERLTDLRLVVADAPGQPEAPTEAHFHFITLEQDGFTPPVFPARMPQRPLAEDFAAPATIEAAGVPVWLYFWRDDLPALREKTAAGVPATMREQLLARATQHLGLDPGPQVHAFYPSAGHEWLRPWDVNANWDTVATECAFAYVLTGDLRFGQQARRMLLALADTDDWCYGMIARYPRGFGGHGGPFGEASIGTAAALAYNWTANLFTVAERERFLDRMMWGSWYWLQAYIRDHNYIRGMNQGPWFNCGALTQALVLAERYPVVTAQIPGYEANLAESIALCYHPDGANTEGAGYWTATTEWVCRALPLLAHWRGRPLEELVPIALRRSIDLPIYWRSAASAEWRTLAINDGNYATWNPGHLALFFGCLLDDPTARWAWQETSGRTNSFRDLPLSIIWHRPWDPVARPELPLAKRFAGADYVVLRGGWEQGDLLFALQSGIWGVGGHQHADKNSFDLEAYGERLCPDVGVPAYGDPRGPLFQSTPAHNAIVIDGGNQRAANAPVLLFEHTEAFDRVVSDATACYPGASEVLRRVLYRRPGYLVIADEVELNQPATIASHLHTFGEIVERRPWLVFRGERADLHILAAAPTVWAAESGTLQRAPSEPLIRQVRVTVPRPADQATFLFLLYPTPAGQEPPPVRWQRIPAGVDLQVGEDRIEYRRGEDLRLLEPAGGATGGHPR